MIKIIFLRLLIAAGFVLRPGLVLTPGLSILTPTTGQVVQGIVEISGSIPASDFSYAELSYSFEEAENDNWFLITRIDKPIQDGLLAFWDTTTITDGTYRVRLVMHIKSGDTAETIVEQIRVGNYTHYDVPAGTPEVQNQLLSPENTPTVQENLGPTALPKNPASIDYGEFKFSAISGLILAVLALGMLGIYTFFRRLSRK